MHNSDEDCLSAGGPQSTKPLGDNSKDTYTFQGLTWNKGMSRLNLRGVNSEYWYASKMVGTYEFTYMVGLNIGDCVVSAYRWDGYVTELVKEMTLTLLICDPVDLILKGITFHIESDDRASGRTV